MRGLGWGAFMGLVLAALGIVTPIVWDRYKSATGIELRQVGSSILVGDAAGIDKLRFLYDGQEVSSVAKLDFALVNVGRSSVRLADIVASPTLSVSGGRILDVRITRVTPAALQVSSSIDNARQAVEIGFPLLNPEDMINFTVLASPATATVAASARIAGIRDLIYVPVEQAGNSVVTRLPWTFWIVASFTAFSWLVVLSAFFVLGKESQIEALAKRGALRFPETGKPEDFFAYLKSSFETEKKVELASVFSYLRALPSDQLLLPPQVQELRRQAFAAFSNRRAAKSAVLMVFGLALLGTWYVVSTFLELAGVGTAG